MNSLNNRPIHKILTEQIIDTTSDGELRQTIFDHLTEKIPDIYDKEYETVMSWNKSQQAIYLIWLLEEEVNNGGYNQFYFNSSGEFYRHLPDELRLIGANRYADMMQKANDTYERENEKITKHQDGTLEGFSKSYEDNPLNEFDDMFYELEKVENLEQLQIDYIRNHKSDFIDK